MFSQINRWGQSACLITILSCLLLSTFPGLSPARAGQSYTPRATPYTGAELWYCPPGTGVDNSCFVANLFTYPLTGVTISNPVLTGSITGNGLTNYFANPFTFAGNMTFNSIISNSGSAGYITTVLDNSNDTSNGIQVTGSSTTQAQEIAKSPVQIAWNPGFTGNPGSTFNTAALTATTKSTVNDQIYPWGIIGAVLNYTDHNTTGNPNAVAVNGTTDTELVSGSYASSSWGGNFVVDESNAAGITNPLAYRIATELNLYLNAADTTDNNLRRIGLLVGLGPKTGPNLSAHTGAGIWIPPGFGTVDNGLLFAIANGSAGAFGVVINNTVPSSEFTTFIYSQGFTVDNLGNTTTQSVREVAGTVSALPACAIGTQGMTQFVTDISNSITYRGFPVGGGLGQARVLCVDGTWTFD